MSSRSRRKAKPSSISKGRTMRPRDVQRPRPSGPGGKQFGTKSSSGSMVHLPPELQVPQQQDGLEQDGYLDTYEKTMFA